MSAIKGEHVIAYARDIRDELDEIKASVALARACFNVTDRDSRALAESLNNIDEAVEDAGRVVVTMRCAVLSREIDETEEPTPEVKQ